MLSVRSRSVRRVVLAVGVVVGAIATMAASCGYPANTRYVYRVFDNVTVTRDIPYRTTTDYQGNPITLKLDVYEPTGDTAAKRPAIMWQFGGAWVAGDKNQLSAYAQDAAQRGYVGVAIDYRIRAKISSTSDLVAAATDAYNDSLAAIVWLKDHAADYRIDPNAVITAGYSAGAINAMNDIFIPSGSTPAAGGVAIAGYGFTPPTAGRPPILMFQGTADTTVNPASSKATCDGTIAKGNQCDYVTYAGRDHLIAFSETADIQNRTAKWAFEKVLVPLGYKAVTVP